MNEAIISWLKDHGIKIVIIILLAIVVDRLIDRYADKAIGRFVVRKQKNRDAREIKERAKTLSNVFNTTSTLVLSVIVLLMILPEVGIEIAPLLAGAGIIGLAIGFGSQNLVRDFLSGLFIIIEDQYGIGDVVKIGDKSGVVESLNLRRTVLRDLDGIQHHIPNSEIKTASNLTKDWSRINLDVPVSSSADPDQVVGLLNKISQELHQDPEYRDFFLEAPTVLGLDKFEGSVIVFKILGKTKSIRQWDLTRELRKRIKKEFDQARIESPFSKQAK